MHVDPNPRTHPSLMLSSQLNLLQHFRNPKDLSMSLNLDGMEGMEWKGKVLHSNIFGKIFPSQPFPSPKIKAHKQAIKD